MKKVLKISGILLIIVLIVLGSLYVLSMKHVEEIDRIEINFSGFTEVSDNYTVDFINQTVTHELKNAIGTVQSYTERNGIETTHLEASFTEEQAKQFVRTANLYHMFGWKEVYENPNILDGWWDTITISYTDGTVQTVRCCNKCPPFYRSVMNAFKEYFGEEVSF